MSAAFLAYAYLAPLSLRSTRRLSAVYQLPVVSIQAVARHNRSELRGAALVAALTVVLLWVAAALSLPLSRFDALVLTVGLVYFALPIVRLGPFARDYRLARARIDSGPKLSARWWVDLALLVVVAAAIACALLSNLTDPVDVEYPELTPSASLSIVSSTAAAVLLLARFLVGPWVAGAVMRNDDGEPEVWTDVRKTSVLTIFTFPIMFVSALSISVSVIWLVPGLGLFWVSLWGLAIIFGSLANGYGTLALRSMLKRRHPEIWAASRAYTGGTSLGLFDDPPSPKQLARREQRLKQINARIPGRPNGQTIFGPPR
jgi:hypothetical protein